MKHLDVWPTREYLREMYWSEGLSLTQIAVRLNVSPSTARYWFQVSGVPRRTRLDGLRKTTMRPVDQRFWKFVQIGKDGDCWTWKGSKSPLGYGSFSLGRGPGKGRVLAHRYALQLSTGRPLGDSLVLHSCDNPSCVNPKHLRLGSQKDNMDDRFHAVFRCESCGHVNRVDKRRLPSPPISVALGGDVGGPAAGEGNIGKGIAFSEFVSHPGRAAIPTASAPFHVLASQGSGGGGGRNGAWRNL